MAKTLMVSNDAYDSLKKMKNDKSFTEVIMGLIEKNNKKKSGAGLKECLGLLGKDDDEYNRIAKEMKPLYKKWTKKYA